MLEKIQRPYNLSEWCLKTVLNFMCSVCLLVTEGVCLVKARSAQLLVFVVDDVTIGSSANPFCTFVTL